MANDKRPQTDPVTNPTPADLEARVIAQLAEIKLTRMGHLHQTTCEAAVVVDVVGEHPLAVNLTVFAKDGRTRPSIRGIVVSPPQDGQPTFHLSRDCPWGR